MVAYLQWAAGVVAVAYAVAAFYAWQYSDGLIFLPPPPTYPAGADLLALLDELVVEIELGLLGYH